MASNKLTGSVISYNDTEHFSSNGTWVVETAIGGENISTTVEGRRRFPVRVRFAKDSREDPDALKRLLVPAESSTHV